MLMPVSAGVASYMDSVPNGGPEGGTVYHYLGRLSGLAFAVTIYPSVGRPPPADQVRAHILDAIAAAREDARDSVSVVWRGDRRVRVRAGRPPVTVTFRGHAAQLRSTGGRQTLEEYWAVFDDQDRYVRFEARNPPGPGIQATTEEFVRQILGVLARRETVCPPSVPRPGER